MDLSPYRVGRVTVLDAMRACSKRNSGIPSVLPREAYPIRLDTDSSQGLPGKELRARCPADIPSRDDELLLEELHLLFRGDHVDLGTLQAVELYAPGAVQR